MPPPTERDFAAALRDGTRPAPAGLAAPPGADPQARFAIHRANVAAGLVRALAARFPVTERIVGSAFFAAMAQAFVARHPPRTPLLLAYGDDLADFVAGFAPAAALPYLADIVRLEAARSRAYHAPDAAPLQAVAFAALEAKRLPGLVMRLHPAVAVIASPHPIVTIWAMHGEGGTIAPVEPWTGEDALVSRPHLTVLVRRLPSGGHAFLAALAGGQPLGDAAAAALTAAPDFDLAANLAGLIEAGLVTDVD